MMLSWQDKLEMELQGYNKMRILTTPTIIRWANYIANKKSPLSNNNVHLWIKRMVAMGKLEQVTKGVYINAMTTPIVLPQEAAQYIRKGAIVSLHSSLINILNNPTRIVFAILPLINGKANTGTVESKVGTFRFLSMPKSLLYAGLEKDRLQENRFCKIATPEKALLDWLYLAKSPKSKLTPPPLDIELEDLDMKRLKRLSKLMGLDDALNDYLKKISAYRQDPNVQCNACTISNL